MAETSIQATRNTDAGANTIESLVMRYYAPLTYFASNLVGDKEVAEDIVQDAFVDLLEHGNKVEDAAHARNLLYLIVRNYSCNYLKSSAKKGRPVDTAVLREEDISAQYVRAETNRILYEAIEALPPRTGEIMKLTLDGIKQEEIADRMGITLATVKAQKAEGIRKLRRILGPLSCLLLSAISGMPGNPL